MKQRIEVSTIKSAFKKNQLQPSMSSILLLCRSCGPDAPVAGGPVHQRQPTERRVGGGHRRGRYDDQVLYGSGMLLHLTQDAASRDSGTKTQRQPGNATMVELLRPPPPPPPPPPPLPPPPYRRTTKAVGRAAMVAGPSAGSLPEGALI